MEESRSIKMSKPAKGKDENVEKKEEKKEEAPEKVGVSYHRSRTFKHLVFKITPGHMLLHLNSHPSLEAAWMI
jgi:hypothetical protein